MLFSTRKRGTVVESYGFRGWYIALYRDGKRRYYVGQHFAKEDPKRSGYTMETQEHDSLKSCKCEIGRR